MDDGANLEMNPRVAQVLDEARVLDTARAVADARRLEQAQRFPHAFGAERLAGMRGAVQSAFARVAIGGDVRVDREAGFIARDVERDDAAAAKVLDELCGLHALLFGEMAQRTEDEPRFYSGLADHLFGRAIDRAHYLLGRKPLLEVEQRGEAQLDVDHAVIDELPENILGHQPQGHIALHQAESLVRAREKFREVRAAGGRDVIGLVLLVGDGRNELRYRGEAQRTIEVQVQLDFRQRFQSRCAGHRSGPITGGRAHARNR